MKTNVVPLQLASLSNPGKVRRLNEDAVAVKYGFADGLEDGFGFAVVTDGMGGHRAGDVASRLAIETAIKSLSCGPQERPKNKKQWVDEVFTRADAAIHLAAREHPGRKDMGATMAVAVLHDSRITLAHIGDSRIYRLRSGKLELLTRDDSLLNDQVESGLIAAEDAGDSHNRHLVTRALGTGKHAAAHVREEDLCHGDIYLLCTDGLNDVVDDQDIAVIVDALKTNLELAAEHLVQLANDYGGYDNITVALIRVPDETPSTKRKGWFGRLLGRLTS